jgi:hypothetical protein
MDVHRERRTRVAQPPRDRLRIGAAPTASRLASRSIDRVEVSAGELLQRDPAEPRHEIRLDVGPASPHSGSRHRAR